MHKILISSSEEVEVKSKYSSKEDKIDVHFDDEGLKSMKVFKDETSEHTIYYKYHWRKGNIAFYRCLSTKCKGRAASDIETLFENEKNILSAKKLRVNIFVVCLSNNS
jgi:hypothetical protein